MKQNVLVVSSFYKYVRISAPKKIQKDQIKLCNSLDIKGRILIGKEGINGSVCSLKSNVEKYKKFLKKNELFSDIEFNEQKTEKQAFRKLYISVRKEIVHFGVGIKLKNKGQFLTPKELKNLLDKKEDITLLDTRNDYEAKIGKFMNALTLKIKNFRDFPNEIKNLEKLKNKKIVAYCTGGIRCEKATAFLKENGFKNVYQLKGGILKYGEEFPDTYWEGKCFVFDDRLGIELNKNTAPLNECVWCHKRCDDYINCHNLDCDKLFVCCWDCKDISNNSCSAECRNAPKRRKEFILVENGII